MTARPTFVIICGVGKTPLAAPDVRELLESLSHGLPFLSGTLCPGTRICGKKNCKCQRGKLHPATLRYGFYRGRKFFMKTIPSERVLAVRAAVQRYRLLQQAIDQHIHRSRKQLLPEFQRIGLEPRA